MTSLLIATALLQGQTADIHLKAMPLEKVIARLDEIFHTEMTVSTLLKDKVIFVDATQVTLEDVKKQIALALDASWEFKDSGWHLGQDAKQQKIADERRRRYRTSMMQKTLELRLSTSASSAKYDEAFAAQSFHQSQQNQSFIFSAGPGQYGLPEERLMTRFLAKFGADRIGAVEPGKRVVYALYPNKMQKPLDLSFDQEIAAFRQENEIWARVQEKLRNESDASLKNSGQKIWTPNDMAPRIPDDIGNLYFSIYADTNGLDQLRLVIVSKNPTAPFFSTNASSAESILSKLVQEDFSKKPAEDFKLSPESTNFRSILIRDMPKLTPAEVSVYLDPVNRDPLSFSFSESLAYDAKRLKKNIIALVGDSSMQIDSPTFTESYFDQRFMNELEGIVVQDGSWIRFNSLLLEGPTFPRGDLKLLVTNAYRTRSFRLEDFSALASKIQRWQNVNAIRNLILGFTLPDQAEEADFDAVRCLGLLEPGEQNQAMSRAGIRFGALNARLQQHLTECVFDNQNCGLDISPKSPKVHETFGSIEATLLVPAGIPSQAVFQIDQEAQTTIRIPSKDQPEGASMTAFGWGRAKYAAEHPEQVTEYNFPIDVDAPAYRDTHYTFLFHLYINDDCQWLTSLQRTVKSNDQPFSLRNLPQEFRNDYEAGYQAGAAEAQKAKDQRKKGDGDALL